MNGVTRGAVEVPAESVGRAYLEKRFEPICCHCVVDEVKTLDVVPQRRLFDELIVKDEIAYDEHVEGRPEHQSVRQSEFM